MFMSATLNAEQLIYTLGLDDSRTLWIDIDESMFPAKNRPVFCTLSGNLTHKTMEHELPKVLKEIQTICDRYPNDRILILPHTHAMAEQIDKTLRLPRTIDIEQYRMQLNEWCRVTYDDSTVMQQHLSERLSLLKYDRRILAASNYRLMEVDIKVYETVPGSVLISTYLTSGYNGEDDKVRVLIIPKVMYPDISDEVVKRRLKTNPKWYNITTVQNIVQALGRGVRSETDHCTNFILDSQWDNMYKRSKALIPKYIQEAILWKRRESLDNY
jgi:hypothetical protein